MADKKELIQAVVDGKMSVVDFICETAEQTYARAEVKNPDILWSMDAMLAHWHWIRDAHKNGKKVIFFGGPVPVDIIYAFDCVPFYMNMLPTRLSTTPEINGKFIDVAEKFAAPSMCGMNKTEMGILLCDQFGVKPDAFVWGSSPCDSTRIAYPNFAEMLHVPTFTIDIPFRRDDRGLEYIAKQNEAFVDFMEELTGTKLDWEKMKYRMDLSNQSCELMAKCADLRKHTPCPLPSRMLVLNELASPMSPTQELVDMFKQQLEVGQMMIDMEMGPCMGGEKHRVCLLQNMLWSNIGTLDWMEREYDAITVMDGFGYKDPDHYDDLNDRHLCMKQLGQKMINTPMVHGAGGPADRFVDMVDGIIGDYSVDVSIFMGHVGCKHTWAVAKMVTDMIQDKYGLPTLYIDVDSLDGRYKSTEDIRAAITEYMDTVVNK
ncbi:MAG: 2-hydroxyacyl-CoA dehydratase family protein [Oscillospiraceae bacterium]